MIDSLVKKIMENAQNPKSFELEDPLGGYKDFETICSLWDTYMYMADYSTNNLGEYVYVSPAFCNMLGLSYVKVTKGGFKVVSQQIHPNDLKVIKKIFLHITDFLSSSSKKKENLLAEYKLSYSFRIKVKDGTYSRFSIVSKLVKFDSTGKILLDFGLMSTTNFNSDTERIVYTISKSVNGIEYHNVHQEEFKPDHATDLNLSEREWKVVELLKKGMNSASIAEELSLSQHTVRNHRKNILRKTNTNKITELLQLLNNHGL